MTDRAVNDGVRERDERDARFFAWDVPGDAHIVALVHEADDAERSATVADAIATSVARRREHTLLLSAEAGPSPLDELLGAVSSPGLPAALEGRARLTDVAVQRVDRPFVYLPGGSDPVAMKSLLEDQVLASFVDRVRERGGTLFIVLARETLLLDGLRSLIDGYVALGDVTLPDPANELAQFGRVRYENGDSPDVHDSNGNQPRTATDLPDLPPLPEPIPSTPAASAAPPDVIEAEEVSVAPEPLLEVNTPAVEAEPEDRVQAEPSESWQRYRTKPDFPVRNVAIGVAAVAGIAAVWWAFASGIGGRADAVPPGGGLAAEAVGSSQAETPPPAPPFDESGARAAFDGAPDLGYSVMIASFAAQADADDRLRQLRSDGSGFYFASPTPVRGVVYHRVFAGALGSSDEAQQLMDALVVSGVKSEAGAWHLRPAALAFDLGLFADRAAADRRLAELAAKSLPAYLMTAQTATGAVWRVYGGAYVDERESIPMGEMLTAADEPVELITRRGTIP